MNMWVYGIAAVVALIAGLVVYNRIRHQKAEAAYPPGGSFVEVEGIRLHYICKGEGVPVVFLHGGILSANDFREAMELASSRGYRTIAFDRPGYGYSERPRNGRVTPADQARLIHGALKQMGVEKPIIVAHSWSGLLAMIYALRFPDDISGIVTLGGAMYKEGYPAEHGDPISRLVTTPVLGSMFLYTVPGSPLGAALAGSIVKQTFAPEPVPERYREEALSLWLRPGQFRANREDILAFPPAARQNSGHYGNIKAPVVIVVGEDDPFGTVEQAERLKRDVPHARLMKVPHVGHMIPQNHPHLVMEALGMVSGFGSSASPPVWPAPARIVQDNQG